MWRETLVGGSARGVDFYQLYQIYSPVSVLIREMFSCTVMSVFLAVSDLEVEFMFDYIFDVILKTCCQLQWCATAWMNVDIIITE